MVSQFSNLDKMAHMMSNKKAYLYLNSSYSKENNNERSILTWTEYLSYLRLTVWFIIGYLFFGLWFLHKVFNTTEFIVLTCKLLMQTTAVFTCRINLG